MQITKNRYLTPQSHRWVILPNWPQEAIFIQTFEGFLIQIGVDLSIFFIIVDYEYNYRESIFITAQWSGGRNQPIWMNSLQ